MSVVTAARERVRGRSHEAARLFSDLTSAPVPARRRFMATLDRADLVQVLAVAAREGGTPFAIWRDDPVGFVQDVLRENTWSKPRQILSSIPANDAVAVPSCYASGKTWSASRCALWFSFTHAPGTAKVITMAPTWRQVVRLLWAEIRMAHSRAGLPGSVDMAQLKIPSTLDNSYVAAYGLSAAPWNEAAVQGIHAPSLLLIVDEAGGISEVIGRNFRGMTSTEGSHMLAIGNPPTDDEASWFEGLCTRTNPDGSPAAKVIPISAFDTPTASGEQAPLCRTCTGGLTHRVTKHLVKRSWIAETIGEHGEDSNYVQAKVYARFPRGGPGRVLPALWVDAAAEVEEPELGAGVFVLNQLGLPDEQSVWRVREDAWVRLGVDVAAGGGDEFVIARSIGDLVTIQHASSGPSNSNSNDVAGRVMTEIWRAELVRRAIGTKQRVHVKIDVVGVGWGVYNTVNDWGGQGLHNAVVVPVSAGESPNREPDGATLRPRRKRDEMWLAMRSLLQPDLGADVGRLRLRVDARTLAQMRGPTMSTDPSGFTVIEPKKKMKDRGLTSPDRAEAAIMAVYEPEVKPVRKPATLLV